MLTKCCSPLVAITSSLISVRGFANISGLHPELERIFRTQLF